MGYDPSHNFRIGDVLLSTGIPFPDDGFLHHYAVTAGTDTRLYIDGTLVATFGPISTTAGGTIPGWVASSNRSPSSSTAISMTYGFSAVRLPPMKLQPWRPGGCTDDTWTANDTHQRPRCPMPHTAVWTGSEMIVWGGDGHRRVFQ